MEMLIENGRIYLMIILPLHGLGMELIFVVEHACQIFASTAKKYFRVEM